MADIGANPGSALAGLGQLQLEVHRIAAKFYHAATRRGGLDQMMVSIHFSVINKYRIIGKDYRIKDTRVRSEIQVSSFSPAADYDDVNVAGS